MFDDIETLRQKMATGVSFRDRAVAYLTDMDAEIIYRLLSELEKYRKEKKEHE